MPLGEYATFSFEFPIHEPMTSYLVCTVVRSYLWYLSNALENSEIIIGFIYMFHMIPDRQFICCDSFLCRQGESARGGIKGQGYLELSAFTFRGVRHM